MSSTDISHVKLKTYITDQQVAERYSVSRATIWRWTRKGDFPQPVRFSDCCTRWSLLSLMKHEEKLANRE